MLSAVAMVGGWVGGLVDFLVLGRPQELEGSSCSFFKQWNYISASGTFRSACRKSVSKQVSGQLHTYLPTYE